MPDPLTSPPPSLAKKLPAEWTYQDAKLVPSLGLPPTYPVGRGMLEDDDYWQRGELWVGQRQPGASGEAQLRRIEPQFVPEPLLAEIARNRTNGLLQREAALTFAPTAPAPEDSPAEEAQQAQAGAMVEALSGWWDRKGFWEVARRAFQRTAYAGRAPVRVWIAPGNLTDGRLPDTLPLADALDLVEVGDPLPDAAARYTVPETQRPVAVVLTGTDADARAELWTVEGTGAERQTVLRVLGGTAEEAQPLTLDLGGRLPLVEMRTSTVVTAPVIRQQGLLNFASTVLNRVLETAGFPERYFGNVEPPGVWYPFEPSDAPALAKDTIRGATYWKHRVHWEFGFSTVTELVGLRTEDATGKESFATPSVTFKDPTDPAYVLTAAAAVRSRLYHLCRQGHLANDATAEASGLAYQQARAQFEADLLTLKGPLEGLVRDVVGVVLAYAALMSPEARGFLNEFRPVVNVHISAGPVTPDEARLAIELRAQRILSTATAQSRVGVEDTAAEQAAIDAEPEAQLDLLVKRTAAAAALEALGADVEGAALAVGMDADQARLIASGPQAPEDATTTDGDGAEPPAFRQVA